jgi:hypothetical protein
MVNWLCSRLTYANVVSSLVLFLVASGGTAVALTGSNTVFTDDIAPQQVTTSDLDRDPPAAGRANLDGAP